MGGATSIPSGRGMATFLDYLAFFFFCCAIVSWCIGAYYHFMFTELWRRKMDGADRWSPLNYNIPEPYRTHRRRSLQMMIAMFVFLGLMCSVFYIRGYPPSRERHTCHACQTMPLRKAMNRDRLKEQRRLYALRELEEARA